jgi:polyisoprenoid-binding protein YceI
VSKGTHRVRTWVIMGIVVVVVLGAGGPFVYIHFIEGPAPAKLSLPGDETTTGGPKSVGDAPANNVGSGLVNGTWNVGQGSVAGYRVEEELIGQQSTAVGRTEKVWGSLTVDDGSVAKGAFTVNMATVESDQSMRNAQFDGRIMDVSTYSTAEFVLTKPISLGSAFDAGNVEHYGATGKLTMHGATRAITFPVSMELNRGNAYVLADIPIVFSNWDISDPSVGGFVSTHNEGTLEVLLHMVRGSGNPASMSATSGSSGGQSFGGPVTVPSTTVPPLTVPHSS